MRFRWESQRIEEHLAHADVAITAGGIAAYEALCAGIPLLALSYDSLQQSTITTLARLNACVDLGPGNQLDPESLAAMLSPMESDIEKRRTLSEKGQGIVDGLGAERVVQIIRPLIEKRLLAS